MTILQTLSRRERKILDLLYRLGEASVEDVRRAIAGNPHYSTARAMLRVLEEKGYIWHKDEHLRYGVPAFGRPGKLSPKQTKLAQRLIEEGKAVREIAETFNVHVATIYRVLPEA